MGNALLNAIADAKCCPDVHGTIRLQGVYSCVSSHGVQQHDHKDSLRAMNVAVAIPTYQKAGTIGAAIDSLLSQKGPRFDIYVFDDASSDATDDILKQHYKDRVFHVRNERNLGYVGNVNRCLALHSRYDWIGILHGDDSYLEGALGTLMGYMKEHATAGLLYPNFREIGLAGGRICEKAGRLKIFPAGREAVNACQSIPCSGTFYSARAIRAAGNYSSEYPFSADIEYAARIGKDFDIVEIPETLVCLRRHGNQYRLDTWADSRFIDSFEAMQVRIHEYMGCETSVASRIVSKQNSMTFIGCTARLCLEGRWRAACRLAAYSLRKDPLILLRRHAYRIVAGELLAAWRERRPTLFSG